MSTQTKPTAAQPEVKTAESKGEIALFEKPRIPFHPEIENKFGIDKGQWRVLINSVWPGAKSAAAVVMAVEYCRARKLDIFKRPVHIVEVWHSGLGHYIETVWPGIAEIRTTASRTRDYAGLDTPEFGPDVTRKFHAIRQFKNGGEEQLEAEVTFPAWCRITVYRMVHGARMPFPGPRVMWMETFAWQKGLPVPNDRWQRVPYGQLEKCAEAAALRRAFPEEVGNEYAAEEIEGQVTERLPVQTVRAEVPAEPPVDKPKDAAPAKDTPATTGTAEAAAQMADAAAKKATPSKTEKEAQGTPSAAEPLPKAAKAEKKSPAPAAAKPKAENREDDQPVDGASEAAANAARSAAAPRDDLEPPAELDRRPKPRPAAEALPPEDEPGPQAVPYRVGAPDGKAQTPRGWLMNGLLPELRRMRSVEQVKALLAIPYNEKYLKFCGMQDAGAVADFDRLKIEYINSLPPPGAA